MSRAAIHRLSSSSLRSLPVWLLVLAWGCCEIPPTVPPGYHDQGGEAGWPPLRVYHPDPFHPANLLFHRLFQLDCEGVCGDVPVPRRGPIAASDRIEIAVLLDQIDSGDSDPLPPRGLSLLRVDLGNAIRRFRDGPAIERELAERLGSSLGKLEGETVPLPPPPPGARRQLGADLDPGHPRIAGGELEAWKLQAGQARIFHLRRARWREGGEPWREVPPAEWIAVRSSASVNARLRFATRAGLCSSCHVPERGAARDFLEPSR